jgi:hypothetical protein
VPHQHGIAHFFRHEYTEINATSGRYFQTAILIRLKDRRKQSNESIYHPTDPLVRWKSHPPHPSNFEQQSETASQQGYRSFLASIQTYFCHAQSNDDNNSTIKKAPKDEDSWFFVAVSIRPPGASSIKCRSRFSTMECHGARRQYVSNHEQSFCRQSE